MWSRFQAGRATFEWVKDTEQQPHSGKGQDGGHLATG